MSRPLDILVIYYRLNHPVRATATNHLACYGRYSGHHTYYWNIGVRRLPSRLPQHRFDLVVFDTSFLSARWLPSDFRRLMRRAEPAAKQRCAKVALPQDEWIYTRYLGEFLADFGITHLFSVAPESQWPLIYPEVNRRRVVCKRVLTGYLDDQAIAAQQTLPPLGHRPIDIGYRVRPSRYWLGREGLYKSEMSPVVEKAAQAHRLRTDLSTRDQDALLGDDWLAFLRRCRFTLGAEGGASLLDPEGRFRERVQSYLLTNPAATFSDVEAASFPGEDGRLQLRALSPRHLEACLTGTVQILLEGEYNGILKPDRHYLQLNKDYGNLNEVLDACNRDDWRRETAATAFRDIVASGTYNYSTFVAQLLEVTVGATARWHPTAPATRRRAPPLPLRRNRVAEGLAQRYVVLRSRLKRATLRAMGLGPHASVTQHLQRHLPGSLRRARLRNDKP